MATARQADIFTEELESIPPRKDNIMNACFAAFSSALATVNFGYALGYTAEAELLQNLFKAKAHSTTPNSKIDACNGFDFFAVSLY